jgi:putative transposase
VGLAEGIVFDLVAKACDRVGDRVDDRLTDWKDEFSVFTEVHSNALQRTVTRFYQNLSNLSAKKQNGHKIGMLNWTSPGEFQSMTYSQSGHQTTSDWQSEVGDF